MKKVSIIIPVHNAGVYLSECLESIVRQTYKNIEVILINDGSTDNSYDICLDYVNKYNFFILIDIKNSGVSNARNLGIDNSTGEYITFVDSDDIVAADFIECMINDFKNDVELVACNYIYKYKLKEKKITFEKTGRVLKNEAKAELFKNNSIRGFSCNKMFLSSIIKNNNIHFDLNIKICEDLLFCFEYMNYINSIYINNKSLYFYRMRKSSASNKNNENDLTVFDAIKKMNVIDNNLFSYIDDFYSYLYFKYYKKLKKSSKIKELPKLSIISIVKNANISISTKMYCLVYRFFPEFIKKKIKLLKQKKNQYYE